ncbi:MAG: hypothetical protein QXT68_00985 [Halobacteria archaeon]
MARPDRLLLATGVALLALHLLLPLFPGLVPAPPAQGAAPPAPTPGSRLADIASWWWLFLGAAVLLSGAIKRQPDLLTPRRPSFAREDLLASSGPVLEARNRARVVRGAALVGVGAALFFVNLWLLSSPAILMVLWLWAAVVPAVAAGVLLWFRRPPAPVHTEVRRVEAPATAWPKLHLALRHAAEGAGFRVREEAPPDPRKRGVPPWTAPAAGVKAVRPAAGRPYVSTAGVAVGLVGLGFLIHALLMGAIGVELPGFLLPLVLVFLLAAVGLLLYAGVRHPRGELLVLEEAVLPSGATASITVTVAARSAGGYDPETLRAGFEAVAKALREFSP